jgi:hypothetical protein
MASYLSGFRVGELLKVSKINGRHSSVVNFIIDGTWLLEQI